MVILWLVYSIYREYWVKDSCFNAGLEHVALPCQLRCIFLLLLVGKEGMRKEVNLSLGVVVISCVNTISNWGYKIFKLGSHDIQDIKLWLGVVHRCAYSIYVVIDEDFVFYVCPDVGFRHWFENKSLVIIRLSLLGVIILPMISSKILSCFRSPGVVVWNVSVAFCVFLFFLRGGVSSLVIVDKSVFVIVVR